MGTRYEQAEVGTESWLTLDNIERIWTDLIDMSTCETV
jgi:hypothetical protein